MAKKRKRKIKHSDPSREMIRCVCSHVNPSATMRVWDGVLCVSTILMVLQSVCLCGCPVHANTKIPTYTRVNTRRRDAMLFLCFSCCTCSDPGQNLNKILSQVFVFIPAWCLCEFLGFFCFCFSTCSRFEGGTNYFFVPQWFIVANANDPFFLIFLPNIKHFTSWRNFAKKVSLIINLRHKKDTDKSQ